ncbi:MAG: alpha/beta hydrolase-fold protein [Bacteroidota bacterium]
MNKVFSTLVLSLFILTLATAQGKVVEGLSVKSEILGKSVNYAIYLPPDYETNQRSYPVVYLLHGYTDNETAWVQFGQIDRLADAAIAEGTIPPMIIVMPDAGVSYYINNYDNSVRYEDFFIKEFMPHIEKTNRIRQDRRYRGLSGLSMGGYGALLYAMKYPDLFSATAPLSAAILTEKEVIEDPAEVWAINEAQLYGNNSGKDRLTDHWKSYNPMHLAKKIGPDQLKRVRYYFDCGDDDFLYRGNAAIFVLFRDMGIPSEFRVREGGHNWTYWRTGIIPALEFIGKSFTQY